VRGGIDKFDLGRQFFHTFRAGPFGSTDLLGFTVGQIPRKPGPARISYSGSATFRSAGCQLLWRQLLYWMWILVSMCRTCSF